jgi:hypothetical protein
MQQFPFIHPFKSALHVSGDVFAYSQEQFNCIYSFGKMHRPAADGWNPSAADLKRSINGNCCILLVTYTVVLMMHGHTNIKHSNSSEIIEFCPVIIIETKLIKISKKGYAIMPLNEKITVSIFM